MAGITTDRLYPLAQQQEIARLLPGQPPVAVVESVLGHDGFLLEVEQIGSIVRSAPGDAEARPVSPGAS